MRRELAHFMQGVAPKAQPQLGSAATASQPPKKNRHSTFAGLLGKSTRNKKKTIDSTPVDFKHLVHYDGRTGITYSETGLEDSPVKQMPPVPITPVSSDCGSPSTSPPEHGGIARRSSPISGGTTRSRHSDPGAGPATTPDESASDSLPSETSIIQLRILNSA